MKTYYLTYVVGARGRGKTTLLAKFAVDLMIPPRSIADIRLARTEIENLRRGGWDNLSWTNSTKNLVYVVDDIFTARGMGYKPRVSMELQFERLGLFDGVNEVDYLLPFAKIFIPEIQSKLDSRKSITPERAADYLLRYLERQRKVGVQMWADAQLDDSVDKRFRNLADRIIEVQGQKHQFNKIGHIIGTTWYCLEFDGIFAYSRYKKTGKVKEATATKYHHRGNIFSCVNSFAGKEYFYHGMTGNFHAKLAKPTGYSKKEMLERVAKFPLFKPPNDKGGVYVINEIEL